MRVSCERGLSEVAMPKLRAIMDAETRKQLALAKDEWELVLELLERERKELHAEIHRTDSHDYRVKLSQRLDWRTDC